MKGGRYSIIHRRMWNDAKFRSLTPPQPCGQALWFRFLCGPELGPIPGLFAAREPGLADAMGWQLEPFRKSFRELVENGMAEADWDAGLVWVPNAILYNEPANPNVIKSWFDVWAELPECALKSKAHSRICEYLENRGEQFVSTFRNGCANRLANQEQEQEQESPLPARARDPGAGGTEQRSRIRPRVSHELIHCLRVAIEREQPENGMWSPGNSFSTKEADRFLSGFANIEAALPEIENRIELFAKDKAMHPWTVKKFVDEYNGIGRPKPNDQPARVNGQRQVIYDEI